MNPGLLGEFGRWAEHMRIRFDVEPELRRWEAEVERRTNARTEMEAMMADPPGPGENVNDHRWFL